MEKRGAQKGVSSSPSLADGLTPSQRKAVEHFEGPLLVLAGPGSGKTRVITRRIARLVERGVDPRQILAITFTNKAANEMSARVAALLPGARVWVSTFHKFCARLLRQRAEAVGLGRNFSIYDTGDQQGLLRQVLDELDIDPVHYPPGRIAAAISNAKNDVLTAEDFARSFQESIGNHQQAVTARVYPAYQKALLRANAVDFDDLLLHVVTLLSENPELRAQLDAQYRFILVDEYQDTNIAQYRIVAALSQNYRNLCVTGDPDQSIYGWRGARIDNILRFEADYPNATVVRLEENFRSTKQILRSADELIAHNVHRKANSLITDNDEGEPVELVTFRDGRHEADHIATEIRRCVEQQQRKWSDFAVFYRVNALSRELELAFTRHRVPFQVAAGVAFYERTEIRDLLSYLRLVHNPSDEQAFRRVVNTPTRGIGKTTQNRLAAWAASQNRTLLDAAAAIREQPGISKRAVTALHAFAKLMNDFSLADSGSVEQLLRTIIDRTGYVRPWTDSPLEQDQQRLANVNELVTAAAQYDRQAGENTSLEGFLETTALASDVDAIDPEAGQVTLMTLHAAKGLEFPCVYLIAVEQNFIPHERSIRQGDWREFEEERRLLFVGMTRAEERLVLTQTRQRELRGRSTSTIPSTFLTEMNLKHVDLAAEDDDWADTDFSSHDDDRAELADFDHLDRDPDDIDTSAASRPDRPDRPDAGGVPRPRLITAADLLNGTGRAAELPQGFTVGMAVRHPRYGLGTVISVSGFAKRRTVTVEFDEGTRRETFVAEKCPLQPVGVR